ncbi:MAG: hypothetical protein KAS32_15580 [Candidatus Peribacteraceae bacterium]|nr:hypothetical protein [Candidatus Peribacteraceae bacterium]
MKKIGQNRYYSTEEQWPDDTIDIIKAAESRVADELDRLITGSQFTYNIIKLSRDSISFLFYPKFGIIEHPELEKSITINNGNVSYNHYRNNPPILHRCELLLPNHPDKCKWKNLTKQEEAAGLFENTKIIGRKKQWKKLLRDKNLKIEDFEVLTSR